LGVAGVAALEQRLENTTASINKPIADLTHGELGLFGESELFLLGRIGVFDVLDEPGLENGRDGLGKVATTALCGLGWFLWR